MSHLYPSSDSASSSARTSLFDLRQALDLNSLPSLSFSALSAEDVDPLSIQSLDEDISPYPAPLGPFSSLPLDAREIQTWRILILVTSVNSFAQKVVAYLDHLGIDKYAVQVAGSAESMYTAAERFRPDVIICPFLTARIPETVFTKWITLVIHPGPPGDAGPSSLDWVLMGDTGRHADGAAALEAVTTQPVTSQRSHWGTICFQANEEMDGGAVWAWEQYNLPRLGSITKAQLYQGLHSSGAMLALVTALLRIREQVSVHPDVHPRDSSTWMRVSPKSEWSRLSISSGKPFLGGAVHERPLLQSKSRRPDFAIHSARDVQRIISAGDSQPGGQLPPLSSASKSALFAYGAHVHEDPSTVPDHLYARYGELDSVPNGTILAQRDGAVFIKTKLQFGAGAGVWITHGRLPKKSVKDPLDPKVPMVDAIAKSTHASILDGLPVWEQDTYERQDGTWQEVCVRSEVVDGELAQLVYWNFYNGACSTLQCQSLLRALQWATRPERGNVRIIALMGGSYFSNGIALNTIENAVSPGKETWDNINAIDDIVEFLLSDSASERSHFMRNEQPLAARGITTVACVRSNAAAGGVALAAACDIVIGARGVVLNPAYRAMGLHGSEFHSFSYVQRTGHNIAGHLLRDMTPMSTTEARTKGLVDIEIGSHDSTPAEIELGMIEQVRSFLSGNGSEYITSGTQSTPFAYAPWCHSSTGAPFSAHLLDGLNAAKLTFLAAHPRPLVHYRNEELSQMLLDSFHPVRSQRYHSRREAFIRKYKSTSTPARYARALAVFGEPDIEDFPVFDDAPGWIRGEEWSWVDLPTPRSLITSESTRVDLFPDLKPSFEYAGWERKSSVASNSTIRTEEGHSLPSTPGFPGASFAGMQVFSPTPATAGHSPGVARKRRGMMGMQGFEMPTFPSPGGDVKGLNGVGVGVGSGVGVVRGDVQFPCLYQVHND